MTNLEDWSTLVGKIVKAYDTYIKNTIYDTMVDYSQTMTGMFKKTGSITEANLRQLCDLVSTAMGTEVMLLGTRTALQNVNALTNVTYYSEKMKDELNNSGMLGNWQGIELVTIPQVFEKNKVGTYKIDNTMIWVMPKTAEKWIKLVNEGDAQISQVTDKDVNRDMTYEYEMQMKLGVGILLSGVFGVYDIDG